MTDALFQSQGAPYGNFKTPGVNYQGTIVAVGQVQSRKFNPKPGEQGELEFWPDGKPKMTAIITIQTNLRDQTIEGDDGQRSIWVKGKSMTDSVKAALRKSGAARRGMEVGGWFSMTFTHETPNDWGGNPTKHYDVEYVLPENNPQRHQAVSDPWANVEPPSDFLVPPNAPVYGGPQQAPQPYAQQVPQGQPFGYPQQQAPQPYAQPAPPPYQAPAPQVPAAAPQPPAAAPAAPAGSPAGFDTSGLSEEAKAAVQAMLAAQAGGQQ